MEEEPTSPEEGTQPEPYDLEYTELLLETIINRFEILLIFNIFMMIIITYFIIRSFRK